MKKFLLIAALATPFAVTAFAGEKAEKPAKKEKKARKIKKEKKEKAADKKADAPKQ